MEEPSSMSPKRGQRTAYETRIKAMLERSSALDFEYNQANEDIEIAFKRHKVSQMSQLFSKTRDLIKTSHAFRLCSYLISERRIIVVVAFHVVISFTIWLHFSTLKFRTQEATVPDTANRYAWKVYTPTLEFGLMHTILFQMAVLPLTMSRLSIANLCSYGGVAKLIPFNRMMNFHIIIGYLMIIFILVATIIFLIFFGLLCSDGEQVFCDNLTSQIMMSGYLIVGLVVLVLISSYFRQKLPYEVFYVMHHLVFVLFLLTAAHTLDNKQRSGEKDRSQTFKWFTASLLYYLCDRAAMCMNHRYNLPIVTASTQASGDNNRIVFIRTQKPAYFQFEPGQYAYLRIKAIDGTWHPFAIASAPDSDELEFIIEVCGGTESWTNELWMLLFSKCSVNGRHELKELFNHYLEIVGPYGCSLGGFNDHSHAIIIGAGSGIVPMISLFKQNIRNTLKLDAGSYLKGEERRMEKMKKLYQEKKLVDGSLFNAFYSRFLKRSQLIPRQSISNALLRLDASKLGTNYSFENDFFKEIEQSAFKAMVPLYIQVFRLFTSVLGVAMISTTVSAAVLSESFITVGGKQLDVKLLDGMKEWLLFGTLFFQSLFLLEVIFVHSRIEFFIYLDILILIASAFFDIFCFVQDSWGSLNSDQVVVLVLFMTYMWFRSWFSSIEMSNDMFEAICKYDRSTILSKLHLVCVTRSGQLISTVLPEISRSYSRLVQEWGSEATERLCQISIYVTDDSLSTDVSEKLKEFEIPGACVTIGERPDFSHLIDQHMVDRISEENCGKEMFSNTLLAFCGSPALANVVHEAKIQADIAAISSGNKYHRIEFVSESYGYGT